MLREAEALTCFASTLILLHGVARYPVPLFCVGW